MLIPLSDTLGRKLNTRNEGATMIASHYTCITYHSAYLPYLTAIITTTLKNFNFP